MKLHLAKVMCGTVVVFTESFFCKIEIPENPRRKAETLYHNVESKVWAQVFGLRQLLTTPVCWLTAQLSVEG